MGKIQQLYNEQQFIIRWWSILVNPFYLIRRALYLEIKQLAPQLKGHLLDFGCGAKPYQTLFQVSQYTGVDIENPAHPHGQEPVDVFYNGNTLPFPDQHFDSFLSSEVFEHVFNPDEMLAEIHRVLKPGSLGLLSTPFVWNEHEVPYDFGRYTSFGWKHVLEKNGFEVMEMRKTTPFITTLFQLFALYFHQLIKSRNRWLNVFTNVIFVFPFNLIGLVLGKTLPDRGDFYHNLVVVVRKKS